MNILEITQKQCSKCGQTKSVEFFQRDRTKSRDGFQSQCRACKRGVPGGDAPVYKVPKSLGPIDWSIWMTAYARVWTCLFCGEKATTLLELSMPVEPTEDLRSRVEHCDAYCGACTRKEGTRVKLARKNRRTLVAERLLEADAHYDAMIAAKRSKGVAHDYRHGELVGSSLAVAQEQFERRASHREDYYEIVERTPILDRAQLAKIKLREMNMGSDFWTVWADTEETERDERKRAT